MKESNEERETDPLLSLKEGSQSNRNEKNEYVNGLKTTIEAVVCDPNNEAKLAPFFSASNLTGAFLRKKNAEAKAVKNAFWQDLKEELVDLNSKERQKLKILLLTLSLLRQRLCEEFPPDIDEDADQNEEKKLSIFELNIHINENTHQNIDNVLSAIPVNDPWFDRGEGLPLTEAGKYMFLYTTIIALFQAYLDHEEKRDNKLKWLGIFISLVASLGCGLAVGCASYAFLIGAISIGAPIAGISLGALIMALSYSIGKVIDRRKWAIFIGLLLAIGIPIALNFAALPVLLYAGAGAICTSGFLTNLLIFLVVVCEFLVRAGRGRTFKYDKEGIVTKGDQQIDEMTLSKKLFLCFMFVLSLIVGFSIGVLFLQFILPTLAFLGIAGFILSYFIAAATFAGYSILMSSYILDAARSDGGVWIGVKKMFKSVMFNELLASEKILAYALAIPLCAGTAYGVASLGLAQSIGIQALLAGIVPHVWAFGLGIAFGPVITTLLLLPFYLTTTAICAKKIVKFFGDEDHENGKKEKELNKIIKEEYFDDILDSIERRDIYIWGSEEKRDFTQLPDAVLKEKQIIVIKTENKHSRVFTEIEGVMVSKIIGTDVVEGYDPADKASKDKLSKHIYQVLTSREGSFIERAISFIYELWKHLAQNLLTCIGNVIGNGMLVFSGGIEKFNNSNVYKSTATVAESGASAGAFGGSRKNNMVFNQYRNETISDLAANVAVLRGSFFGDRRMKKSNSEETISDDPSSASNAKTAETTLKLDICTV